MSARQHWWRLQRATMPPEKRVNSSPSLNVYKEEYIYRRYGDGGAFGTNSSCRWIYVQAPGSWAPRIPKNTTTTTHCHTLAEKHFQGFIGFMIIFILSVDKRTPLTIAKHWGSNLSPWLALYTFIFIKNKYLTELHNGSLCNYLLRMLYLQQYAYQRIL